MFFSLKLFGDKHARTHIRTYARSIPNHVCKRARADDRDKSVSVAHERHGRCEGSCRQPWRLQTVPVLREPGSSASSLAGSLTVSPRNSVFRRVGSLTAVGKAHCGIQRFQAERGPRRSVRLLQSHVAVLIVTGAEINQKEEKCSPSTVYERPLVPVPADTKMSCITREVFFSFLL